jgi:hypothetical protein
MMTAWVVAAAAAAVTTTVLVAAMATAAAAWTSLACLTYVRHGLSPQHHTVACLVLRTRLYSISRIQIVAVHASTSQRKCFSASASASHTFVTQCMLYLRVRNRLNSLRRWRTMPSHASWRTGKASFRRRLAQRPRTSSR